MIKRYKRHSRSHKLQYPLLVIMIYHYVGVRPVTKDGVITLKFYVGDFGEEGGFQPRCPSSGHGL